MTTTTHHETTTTTSILVLGLFALICAAVAALGGAVTTPEIRGWYASIEKPTWNPPDWVFGPVWTTLFALMAIAAWLVWRRAGWRAGRLPLTLFGIQLGLNLLWSCLFFGLRSPGAALVDVVLLWVAILATIIAFARWSRLAALLLVPYLLWVGFAAILNFTIWRLNL